MSECFALQDYRTKYNLRQLKMYKCTHCIIVHVFEKPCDLAGLNILLISVLSCANSFAISAAEKQVEMRSGGGGIPIYRD
jgi:hypothetical protein